MNLISETYRWLTDAANWRGDTGIPARLAEHAGLCAFAVVAAALVAVPLGLVVGHRRRGGAITTAVVNIGRAIPSFAIIAVAFPIALQLDLGLGYWPTWLAMFLLALPPIFTNTATGVREVDPRVVDAARGMGMHEPRVLARVELPLAAPLIAAGIRTATVAVIATAPLGALVAWGGLGRFIIDGLAQQNTGMLGGGATLVALLSIIAEIVLGAAQRFVTPRGLREPKRVRARLEDGEPLVATAR